MSDLTGVELIHLERQRQIEVEGYTAEHDAQRAHALARAGACYALNFSDRVNHLGDRLSRELDYPPVLWPWAHRHWKPTPDDRIRELTKAGALIAAAIDSLLREQDNAGN